MTKPRKKKVTLRKVITRSRLENIMSRRMEKINPKSLRLLGKTLKSRVKVLGIKANKVRGRQI